MIQSVRPTVAPARPLAATSVKPAKASAPAAVPKPVKPVQAQAQPEAWTVGRVLKTAGAATAGFVGGSVGAIRVPKRRTQYAVGDGWAELADLEFPAARVEVFRLPEPGGADLIQHVHDIAAVEVCQRQGGVPSPRALVTVCARQWIASAGKGR